MRWMYWVLVLTIFGQCMGYAVSSKLTQVHTKTIKTGIWKQKKITFSHPIVIRLKGAVLLSAQTKLSTIKQLGLSGRSINLLDYKDRMSIRFEKNILQLDLILTKKTVLPSPVIAKITKPNLMQPPTTPPAIHPHFLANVHSITTSSPAPSATPVALLPSTDPALNPSNNPKENKPDVVSTPIVKNSPMVIPVVMQTPTVTNPSVVPIVSVVSTSPTPLRSTTPVSSVSILPSVFYPSTPMVTISPSPSPSTTPKINQIKLFIPPDDRSFSWATQKDGAVEPLLPWVFHEETGYWTTDVASTQTVLIQKSDPKGSFAIETYAFHESGSYTIENHLSYHGTPRNPYHTIQIAYASTQRTMLHASMDGGEWSTAPMSFSDQAGYVVSSIRAKERAFIHFSGINQLDDRYGRNYELTASKQASYVIDSGTLRAISLSDLKKFPITKVYHLGHHDYMMHGIAGQNWTSMPGDRLSASLYAGYKEWSAENKGKTFYAAFHDNKENWDSRSNLNYVLPPGTWTIANHTLIEGTPDQVRMYTVAAYDLTSTDAYYVYVRTQKDPSDIQLLATNKQSPYHVVTFGANKDDVIQVAIATQSNASQLTWKTLPPGTWIWHDQQWITDPNQMQLKRKPTDLVGDTWDYRTEMAAFRWTPPSDASDVLYYELIRSFQGDSVVVGKTERTRIMLTFSQLQAGKTFDTTLDLLLRVRAVYADGRVSGFSNTAYYVEEAAFDWKRMIWRPGDTIRLYVYDSVKTDAKSFDGLQKALDYLKPWFVFAFVDEPGKADWVINGKEDREYFNVMGFGIPNNTSRHNQMLINAYYGADGYLVKNNLWVRSYLHEFLHAIGLNHQPNGMNEETTDFCTIMSYGIYNRMCEMDAKNLNWLLHERKFKPKASMQVQVIGQTVRIQNTSVDDVQIPYFINQIKETHVRIENASKQIVFEKQYTGVCGTHRCEEDVLISPDIARNAINIPIRMQTTKFRVLADWVYMVRPEDWVRVMTNQQVTWAWESYRTQVGWSDWMLVPDGSVQLTAWMQEGRPAGLKIGAIEYDAPPVTLDPGTYDVTLTVVHQYGERDAVTQSFVIL